MADVLELVLTLLDISSFLLHLIGIYLLLKTYSKGIEDLQHIFITSLAVSEMFISIFQLLFTWIPNDAGDAEIYLKNIHFYVFSTMYYLSMIFIPIERFLDIRLNIKYPLYWSEKKTKRLLVAMWSLCCCIATLMCFVFHLTNKALIRPHSLYLFLSLDIIFVVVTFVTYGYIFRKYRQSCEPPVQGASSTRISAFAAFRRSRRFYVILFLVTTFFLFTVVPDIIVFCTINFDIMTSKKMAIITACRILYAVSRSADAYAYILMDSRIRKVILKICRRNIAKARTTRSQTMDSTVGSTTVTTHC